MSLISHLRSICRTLKCGSRHLFTSPRSEVISDFSSFNHLLPLCGFIIKMRNLFIKLVPELRENCKEMLQLMKSL